MIVQSLSPVTLVGGADLGTDDLKDALMLAPALVAADGGARHLRAAGLVPQAVIGDLDSLTDADRAAFADRLHKVAEQETTDFDKALRAIAAPLVVAIGFAGGRFDHELAVLHSLLRHPDRPCLLIGRDSLTCLCPPDLALDLAAGTLVSLFPLVPVRIASEGLVWPTGGLDFHPARRIGTSNAATGPVRLRPDGPGMLLILPRAARAALVTALRQAPRWPAVPGG